MASNQARKITLLLQDTDPATEKVVQTTVRAFCSTIQEVLQSSHLPSLNEVMQFAGPYQGIEIIRDKIDSIKVILPEGTFDSFLHQPVTIDEFFLTPIPADVVR